MEYRYILKVEPSGCANEFEIEYERKRKVKDDTKIFGLKNWKIEMLFIDMGKTVGRVLTFYASSWTNIMPDMQEYSVNTNNLIIESRAIRMC